MAELMVEARRESRESEVVAESAGAAKLSKEFIARAVIMLMKRDISERYAKTHEVTDEDWEFCEKIDWHPVDELPLKESFVKELEKARKEPSGKAMTREEFKKWCDGL